MTDEELGLAQHEAAHVVVGVALGLRLWRATIHPGTLPKSWHRWERETAAITVWEGTPYPREADLLMTAAGVAWERKAGDLDTAAGDIQVLRRLGVRGNARLKVLETAAWAVLAARAAVHAKVTRALLEGDVNGRTVRAMMRGEKSP